MSETQMLFAAIVLTPMVILGLAGMIRGYHMHLKVWRGNDERDQHGDH